MEGCGGEHAATELLVSKEEERLAALAGQDGQEDGAAAEAGLGRDAPLQPKPLDPAGGPIVSDKTSATVAMKLQLHLRFVPPGGEWTRVAPDSDDDVVCRSLPAARMPYMGLDSPSDQDDYELLEPVESEGAGHMLLRRMEPLPMLGLVPEANADLVCSYNWEDDIDWGDGRTARKAVEPPRTLEQMQLQLEQLLRDKEQQKQQQQEEEEEESMGVQVYEHRLELRDDTSMIASIIPPKPKLEGFRSAEPAPKLPEDGLHPQLLRLNEMDVDSGGHNWVVELSSHLPPQGWVENVQWDGPGKPSQANKDKVAISLTTTDYSAFTTLHPTTAAALLNTSGAAPLLLDLNDKRMVFTVQQGSTYQGAAAIVLETPARPEVAAGPPMADCEVSNDLARFNVSNDHYYAHQKRRDKGIIVMVKHAVPSLGLSTFNFAPTKQELLCFHRPRSTWHPQTLVPPQQHLRIKDISLKGGSSINAAAAAAAVSAAAAKAKAKDVADNGTRTVVTWVFKSLSGATTCSVSGEATSEVLSQSIRQLMQSTGVLKSKFTEAQKQPFKLLACRPLRPLDPDLSLQEQGLGPSGGDGGSGIAGSSAMQHIIVVIFPEVKLLLSRLTNVTPAVESQQFMRPPSAFRKKQELTSSDGQLLSIHGVKGKKQELTACDGHLLLLEYMEQAPVFLAQRGMGVKLTTYYKKKSETDMAGQQLMKEAAAVQAAASAAAAAKATGTLPGAVLAGASAAAPAAAKASDALPAPAHPSASVGGGGSAARTTVSAQPAKSTDLDGDEGGGGARSVGKAEHEEGAGADVDVDAESGASPSFLGSMPGINGSMWQLGATPSFLGSMPGINGSMWRLGNILQLGVDDDSPFLGSLHGGQKLLSVEGGAMFRAPATPFLPKTSDFILIRNSQGVLSIREFTGSFAVGQQQPALRVPLPGSTAQSQLLENRLVAHVTRELRIRQSKLKKKGLLEPPHITVPELIKLFRLDDASIKKLLLERCMCAPFRAPEGKEVFRLQDGVELMQETELRRLISPDLVCSYEAMLAAEARHRAKGLSRDVAAAAELIEWAVCSAPWATTDSFVSSMKEKRSRATMSLVDVAAAAELIEWAVCSAPWATTDSFVSSMKEKRSGATMSLVGPADPTGHGHGFSFMKELYRRTPKGTGAPETGSITGSEADLRKLSAEAAAKILIQFGVMPEIVASVTDRWKRIDMFGVMPEIVASVTDRWKRIDMVVASVTDRWKRIDKQLALLAGDREPTPPGDGAPSMSFKTRQRAGIPTGAGPVGGAPTAQDEEREYRCMRDEGFFGQDGKTPSKDSGLSSSAANADAKPGDRRLRRTMYWSTAEDSGLSSSAADADAKPGDRRLRRTMYWSTAEGVPRSQSILYTDRAEITLINVLASGREAGGFGERRLQALPQNAYRAGDDALYQRVHQKERRLALATGRGRGRGRGRGASIHASPGGGTDHAGRGRGRGRGRGHRADADAAINLVDGGDISPYKVGFLEGDTATPPKPRKSKSLNKETAPKGSSGGVIHCSDCDEEEEEEEDAEAAYLAKSMNNTMRRRRSIVADVDYTLDDLPCEDDDGVLRAVNRRKGGGGRRRRSGAKKGDEEYDLTAEVDEDYIPEDYQPDYEEDPLDLAEAKLAAKRASKRRVVFPSEDEYDGGMGSHYDPTMGMGVMGLDPQPSYGGRGHGHDPTMGMGGMGVDPQPSFLDPLSQFPIMEDAAPPFLADLSFMFPPAEVMPLEPYQNSGLPPVPPVPPPIDQVPLPLPVRTTSVSKIKIGMKTLKKPTVSGSKTSGAATLKPQDSLDWDVSELKPQDCLDWNTSKLKPHNSLDWNVSKSKPQDSLDWNASKSKPEESLDWNASKSKPQDSLDWNSSKLEPQDSLDWNSSKPKPQGSLDWNSSKPKPQGSLDWNGGQAGPGTDHWGQGPPTGSKGGQAGPGTDHWGQGAPTGSKGGQAGPGTDHWGQGPPTGSKGGQGPTKKAKITVPLHPDITPIATPRPHHNVYRSTSTSHMYRSTPISHMYRSTPT
eukprot:gene13935-19866_t